MPGIRRKSDSINSSVFEPESEPVRMIGMVDGSEEDSNDVVIYCTFCYEKTNQFCYLGSVILEADQPVPHDYYNWRQCHSCGRKYAISKMKRESKISDMIDIEDEDNENGLPSGEYVEPIKFRNKGRKGRLERWRETQNLSRMKIKDPDAIAAIKKGLEVENYQEYQLGQD